LLTDAGRRHANFCKLQRVLNAADRVVFNSGKYDHGLTHLQRHVLHWLDVADRIRFRLCVQMSAQHGSWIPGRALPTYLQHRRTPASTICSPWPAASLTFHELSGVHTALDIVRHRPVSLSRPMSYDVVRSVNTALDSDNIRRTRGLSCWTVCLERCFCLSQEMNYYNLNIAIMLRVKRETPLTYERCLS